MASAPYLECEQTLGLFVAFFIFLSAQSVIKSLIRCCSLFEYAPLVNGKKALVMFMAYN